METAAGTAADTTAARADTAVIGIGRDVGRVPMESDAWARFRAEVREVAEDTGGRIVFSCVGTGDDGTGRMEDSATLVLTGVPVSTLETLQYDLGDIAARYGQDSIALTVGVTDFVHATRAAGVTAA